MFFWRRGSGFGWTTLPPPRVRSRFKVTGDWQPTASLWLPGTVPYTSLRERASLRLPDQLPTGLKILCVWGVLQQRRIWAVHSLELLKCQISAWNSRLPRFSSSSK